MAQKNNIRSIRFSDELADLIDRQVGKTFTEKFENLVTRCVWKLPQKEEQLHKITEAIQAEQLKLLELRKRSGKLQHSLQVLTVKFQSMNDAIDAEIRNVTQ